jgi:4-hydroxy-4-methyl-2-oxoglutarate aldolase
VESTIASSLAREEKETKMRAAIEQGASTVELMNLAETLQKFGLV